MTKSVKISLCDIFNHESYIIYSAVADELLALRCNRRDFASPAAT